MINLPKLDGKTVYLRALCLEDANGPYPNWLNDPEVTKYNSHGDIKYTKQMAIDYIRTVTKSPKHCVFAIIDKTTQQHLGNISLQMIDFDLETAEFAILIGEPSVYGKGIGYEAGELLLDYGFNTLHLKQIYCGTSENNLGMQKLALKLGMIKYAIVPKALKKNGNFFDVIKYKIRQL